MVRSPSSDRDLRAAIVRCATEAGADAVRIASAAPDAATRERLAASIARGDLASWPYDDAFAARAADPQQILASARSIVCLALGYGGRYAAPRGRADPGAGRVSRYVRGRDYHARLREIAERVAREIDAVAGAPASVIACDTAPLAERAFAARAGLGWVGKHTNLIAPGLGSFVFLAEILTTLPLVPDPPLRRSCGACARCVDACPTGALRGDHTIDARRCISDLTQRRDAIPRELRALVGTWVWGCDLCQDVCPPTRLAASRSGAPAEDAGVDERDLRELLTLRSAAFTRRYRRTAMGWRGAAVLRRNAAVALGNAGDRAAVPALAHALASDTNALVRGHAAWALGRLGSPAARTALATARAREADGSVREEIDAALEGEQPLGAASG